MYLFVNQPKALLCLSLSIVFISILGCSKAPDSGTHLPMVSTETQTAGTASSPVKVQDKPLADFQTRLLDMAFDAARAIPAEPYIKDRSRAQEKVVETCLKLGQPVRAIRHADQIDNWRRGLCYANVAFYLAQNGYDYEQLQKGLEIAEQIAGMDHGQKWRNDAIKVRIAQVKLLVGKVDIADPNSKALEESESGKLLEVEMMTGDEADFNKQVERLDASIALQNFDITHACLNGYAQLFNRHYEHPERRALAEEKIKSSWQKLPVIIRLELMIKLAGFALEHSDKAKALELVNESQNFMDPSWPLEKYIPMMSQLIALRYQSGDTEKAKTDADSVNDLYDQRATAIIDIYRAESLYPLAEAYQAMGDKTKAMSVYKKAIEAGVVNPNLKPRAEDLSATCCSMAVYAIEPDVDLWARMHDIARGLSNP